MDGGWRMADGGGKNADDKWIEIRRIHTVLLAATVNIETLIPIYVTSLTFLDSLFAHLGSNNKTI